MGLAGLEYVPALITLDGIFPKARFLAALEIMEILGFSRALANRFIKTAEKPHFCILSHILCEEACQALMNAPEKKPNAPDDVNPAARRTSGCLNDLAYCSPLCKVFD